MLSFSKLGLADTATEQYLFPDKKQTEQFQQLTQNLRCLVCQGESLNESQASFALDLKQDIADKIRQGQKNPEILKTLTAEYSTSILFTPPVNHHTLPLWIFPFVILCLLILFHYRR